MQRLDKPRFHLCLFRYLDFVHTVSGVQATDALQCSSNIPSCGIPSQIQTLLLFSIRQYTPGNWTKQLKGKLNTNIPANFKQWHAHKPVTSYLPVVFWLETQLTDRRGRRRRKATGRFLSRCFILALVRNLLWESVYFKSDEEWIDFIEKSHSDAPSFSYNLVLRQRERGGERVKGGRIRQLDVERRKHYIIPLPLLLKSKSSVDNPSSISW